MSYPQIKVQLCTDSEYPGLLIHVRDMSLVLVEYDIESKKHMVHVWDKETWNGGDEVYHQDIPDDWEEKER
jgi:hypothetical protein